MRTHHLLLLAAFLIVAAATGLHFVSCADETLPGGEIFLGDLDGYTEAEIVAKLDAFCATRVCDGEIPVPLAPLAGKDLAEYDDDLEALLYLLYGILPLPMDLPVLLDLASDYHPPELAADMEMLGPFRATINLNEACAPGTGSVTVIFTETLRRVEGEEGAGTRQGLEIYLALIMINYLIQASDCHLFGMTMEAKPASAKADVGVIRAGILNIKPSSPGSPPAQQGTGTDQGNTTVNKGAGGKKADGEPYYVWGIDQVVSGNFQFLLDPADLAAPYTGTGGVCYGGTVPTAADCEGIFVPAADVAPFLLSPAPLP
ncbi:MAG: hypothetical protein AB1405_12940 [Bdellovibrionota bacterium]